MIAVVRVLVGTSATFPTVPSSVSTCAMIGATASATVATFVSFYAPTTTSDGIGPSVALDGSFFAIVVIFFCHEKSQEI